MKVDEQQTERGSEGREVHTRDYANHRRDLEAGTGQPGDAVGKGNGSAKSQSDKQMKRTISFQEGSGLSRVALVKEKMRGERKVKRWRARERSQSISSAATTEEDEDDVGGVGDEDESSYDDGLQRMDTGTTGSSDEEDEEGSEEDEQRLRPVRSRLTPSFVSRSRERRRKRKKGKAAKPQDQLEIDDGTIKTRVFRRTPVLTGVIAPFSIMLEIPGFTSRWYVRLNDPTFYRPNPAILDVGLSFSLASAVVANVAILGRFAERLTPRRATLVAVVFFIFHDVINAVALISFGVIHAVDDGYTYSEAYWMTTASTAASVVCTLSLIVDYLGTKNFSNAGSGLTPKQAQLVMVIMAFLAYISISAMIFALIMPLPFLDSMYFMVESLATVGLGDIVPKNLGSRIALFFVAPGGIVLLAVVVAISRQTIIEEFENAYKRRRALYRQKAAERQEERRRNRHLRLRLKRGAGRGATTLGSDSNIAPLSPSLALTQRPLPAKSGLQRWLDQSWSSGFAKRTKGQERQGEERVDEEVAPSSYVDMPTAGSGLELQRTETTTTNASQLREYEKMLVSQRKDIEDNFDSFQKELSRAERNEFWIKLTVAASLFACFWVVGAAIFSTIEQWTFFQGFYFVFVIFTSIGYGDLAPKSSSGRAFFIVWGLLGVGTLTILFSVLSDAWAHRVQQKKMAGGKGKKRSRLSKIGRWIHANRSGERREKDDAHVGEEEKTSGVVVLDTGSEAKRDGILMDEPSSMDRDRGGEQEQPSPGSSDSKDIGQLHFDFTATAMQFHKNALDFMKHSQSSIADTFRNVPEMAHIARRVGAVAAAEHQDDNDGQASVTEEDRSRLLDAVQQTGDVNALLATRQWLLIHDFENTLHSLVNKSAAFQAQLEKKDGQSEETESLTGHASPVPTD